MPDAVVNDRLRLTRWVRERLGCGCPDELFAEMRLVIGYAGIDRLRIGGRLLVWGVRGESTPARVAGLACAGLAARDAAGFRRFRLVLVEPGGQPAELEAAFARATEADPRAHLHLVAAHGYFDFPFESAR